MEPTQVAGAGNKLRLGVIGGAVIVVLIVSAIVYLSHPTPTGITIALTSGKVSDFSTSDVYLNIVFVIKNTSPNTITYWGSSYALNDNGAGVDNGLWNDHVVLAAGQSHVLNETADIALADDAGLTTSPITAVGTWEVQGVATELVNGGNVTQNYQFNFSTQ